MQPPGPHTAEQPIALPCSLGLYRYLARVAPAILMTALLLLPLLLIPRAGAMVKPSGFFLQALYAGIRSNFHACNGLSLEVALRPWAAVAADLQQSTPFSDLHCNVKKVQCRIDEIWQPPRESDVFINLTVVRQVFFPSRSIFVYCFITPFHHWAHHCQIRAIFLLSSATLINPAL